MATLRIKPKPYDFNGERERIAAHEVRFHNAVRNSGNRPVCPYCYSTPVKQFGRISCGCP